jgi:hypothetical protein
VSDEETGKEYNFTSKSTILEPSKNPMSYVEVVEKCVPFVRLCALAGVPNLLCPLSCIVDNNPVARRIVNPIISVVDSFCEVVDSQYEVKSHSL